MGNKRAGQAPGFPTPEPLLFYTFLFRASWFHSTELTTTRNEKSLNLTIVVEWFSLFLQGKNDYSGTTQLYDVNNPDVLLAISKRVNSLVFSQLKYKM